MSENWDFIQPLPKHCPRHYFAFFQTKIWGRLPFAIRNSAALEMSYTWLFNICVKHSSPSRISAFLCCTQERQTKQFLAFFQIHFPALTLWSRATEQVLWRFTGWQNGRDIFALFWPHSRQWKIGLLQSDPLKIITADAPWWDNYRSHQGILVVHHYHQQ